jgi:lipopolysaccharide export system protein LptA
MNQRPNRFSSRSALTLLVVGTTLLSSSAVFAETGIITLSGNAFLSQNGATFRGENLKYSMSKGDIQADGGSTGQKKGRIQIVIPPSAQQSLSGVND